MRADRRRIDVVIPVYGALRATRKCVFSVAEAGFDAERFDVRFIVIDDASPGDDFHSHLRSVVPADWVLLRNEENLGFPATVNRGFGLDDVADVIILNSDTEVSAGWIDGLAKVAARDDSVATVTPLSNNASIYSWPERDIEDDTIRRVLEGCAELDIKIPVGVGFCMYLRRAAIVAADGFDETFGRGYGEETDFCLKTAALGFTHRLAPGVYVRHKGGASMASVPGLRLSNGTDPRNEAIVARRYPKFKGQIESFLPNQRDPLFRELDRRLFNQVSRERKHVLVIQHRSLHDGFFGGVEMHVAETVAELSGQIFATTLTALPTGGFRVSVGDGLFDQQMPLAGDLESAEVCSHLLASLQPDVVHIQHPMGCTDALWEAFAKHELPIVMSIHDQYLLCPKYNLLDGDRYCELPAIEDDKHRACLAGSKYAGIDLQDWRDRSQRMLDMTQTLIFVSDDARRRMASVLKIGHSLVIPCGVAGRGLSVRHKSRKLANKRRKFSVCILGAPRVDKGFPLSRKIAPRLVEKGIDVHFLGAGRRDWGHVASRKGIHLHGSYHPEKVVESLQRIDPDLVLLPSFMPETFSRALSESWLAGVPVVVPDLGALAVRVRDTDAGWVVDGFDEKAWVETVVTIKDSPDDYVEKQRHAWFHVKPPLSHDVARDIGRVYEQFPKRDGKGCSIVAPQGARIQSALSTNWTDLMAWNRVSRSAGIVLFLVRILARLRLVGPKETFARPLRKLRQRGFAILWKKSSAS